MGRKFIDCRDHPGETKCSLTLAEDTEEELLEAAIQHGVAVHRFQNTPERRDHKPLRNAQKRRPIGGRLLN